MLGVVVSARVTIIFFVFEKVTSFSLIFCILIRRGMPPLLNFIDIKDRYGYILDVFLKKKKRGKNLINYT